MFHTRNLKAKSKLGVCAGLEPKTKKHQESRSFHMPISGSLTSCLSLPSSLLSSMPVSPWPHFSFLQLLLCPSYSTDLLCLHLHARALTFLPPPPITRKGPHPTQFSHPAETDQCLSAPALDAKGNLILRGSGVHSRSDQLRPRAEPRRVTTAQNIWALPPGRPQLQLLEPVPLGAGQLNFCTAVFPAVK